MAGRDLVPSVNRNTPFITEKTAAPSKNPVLGGVHNPALAHEQDHGHSFRTTHEPEDHGALKPVSLRAHNPLRAHRMGAGERDRSGGFFSSDDTALNKQIQATHAPDMEEVDARPILSIVEDILRLARPASGEEHDLARPATTGAHHAAHVPAHLESSHDKQSHGSSHDKQSHGPSHDKMSHGAHHDEHQKVYEPSYIDSEIVKVLAYPINKISSEIICKCASGGESHQVTMDLLKSLSSFTWDAKVVIAFAGFAINYGEFWLVEQHHTKNPLAKNIAILKDLPEIMAQSNELRKQFEAVLDLLHAILKVTHCIIEFKELPPMYISAQSPEITAATAHIPTAVYWCIRGLLVCASTLLSLIGGGHEFITSTSVSWEILNLAHKLSVILEHLQDKMRICKELVGRKRAEDLYAKFKRLLESAHIDNMKVLNAFFRHREDQRPLYHGSRNTNERLDVLRLKYVLLLISDLEVPPEELHVLHLIHNEHAMRHDYEILWLPISDLHASVNEVHDTTFINHRKNMPWFSADHPSAIEPVAIRYIREELRFSHMPMLVVLDPHGKLSHHDALPMMWIWGAKAFPFTREWERKLWEETEWNIDLIADSIDPRIPEWINTNKVICLYGGDDINWVRKFTQSAKTAARALNVQLEMLYVGKRNPKEKVRLCHEVIARENLSHIFATDYYDFVWYFWVRLASMWNSKKQIGRTVEDDHIMQGILNLLTYDSSEQGWAIFSRGIYETTMASGDKLVPILDNYTTWGYEVDHPDKFVPVLDKNLKGYHPEHHCQRLILPGQAGYIPERVVCTECGKTMDKYVMYRCCTD
ncbi:hypothetical protein ACS0TY_009134 [Phlomoides rotata]